MLKQLYLALNTVLQSESMKEVARQFFALQRGLDFKKRVQTLEKTTTFLHKTSYRSC